MPSKTSNSKKEWFSKAMFLQTTNTFLPIPIIYFFVLFLALPMDIFMWEIDMEVYTDVYKDLAVYAQKAILYGLGTNFFFAVLSAMLVFRYLCNSRSANMVHSLPICREALFVTEYLAGLSFVIIPNILILMLTLIALSFHGIFYATPFLYLFWINCGLYFFFYNFAILCAMFTGSLGGTTIFYLIFNFVVGFVVMLLDPIFDMYYLGYHSSVLDYPFVRLLTPVYALLSGGSVSVSYKTTSTDMFAPGGYFHMFPENIIYTMWDIEIFCCYMAAAVVFAVVSLLIYKGRHIEYAGEAVAIPVLKPVVRFSLAVIGGFSMGILSTFLIIDSVEDPSAFYLLPLFSLLFGLVFTFVAEMIMQKSFRVLKYWKRSVLPLVAVALIYTCMHFDLTGFEDTVPTVEEVEKVQIVGALPFPRDNATDSYEFGESDVRITDKYYDYASKLHRAAISSNRSYLEAVTEGVEDDSYDKKSYLKIAYSLNDGYQLQRLYENVTMDKADLANPESFASIFYEIINDEEAIAEQYMLNDLKGNVGNVFIVNLFDRKADDFVTRGIAELDEDLTGAEENAICEALAIAVVADFKEGNIGEKFIFQDDEKYVEDGMPLKLAFEIFVSREDEIANMSAVEVDQEATTEQKAEVSLKPLGNDPTAPTQHTVTISLTQSAVHTLAVLEEFQLLGDYEVITNQEHLERAVDWYEESLKATEGRGSTRKITGSYSEGSFDSTDPMSFVQELK